MISKSRKILTLLLTVLLIMSSMSALSVSADGTAFDANGNMAIANTTEYVTASTGTADVSGTDAKLCAVGDTVTYTISNVPESGYYMVSVDAWSNVGDSGNFFTLTVSDGVNTHFNTATYSNYESLAKTVQMGSLYLEADVNNDITIAFSVSKTAKTGSKDGLTAWIALRDLKIEKVKPIELSTTGDYLTSADWNVNRERRMNYTSDEASTDAAWTVDSEEDIESWMICEAGDYITYNVSLARATWFDIYGLGGSRINSNGKYTLEVNGTKLADKVSSVAIGNDGTSLQTIKSTMLGTFKLPAGTYDIKLSISTAAIYYAGIKFVPYYSLSATDTTIINSHSYDSVEGKLATNYSDVAATGVLEGKYDLIGLANGGGKVYYDVSSPKEQKYSISFVASRPYAQTFKITNTVTGESIQAAFPKSSTGTYSTVEETLGELTIPQGTSQLKIEAVSGTQIFIFQIKLTPVIQNKFYADINTTINKGEGTETVEVPIKFEGKLTLGAVQVNVAYDEGVEYVSSKAGSCYDGGTSAISKAGQNPVKVSWLDMDAVGVEFTTGTYATLTFNVPKSVAKEYNFTVSVIKCEQLTGVEEFTEISSTIETANGKITVVSTDPIIKFTNGSDVETDEVVAGTMKLTVDLNNNAKDLVIFAIYTDDGDFAVMEYSQTATIKDGIATATIENITLDNSKTYYAKAFVWDTTTYYGFTETIGK